MFKFSKYLDFKNKLTFQFLKIGSKKESAFGKRRKKNRIKNKKNKKKKVGEWWVDPINRWGVCGAWSVSTKSAYNTPSAPSSAAVP
jgi:hypothetical protein